MQQQKLNFKISSKVNINVGKLATEYPSEN
jgi:hypothetical protein